jgi:hypothetical protein
MAVMHFLWTVQADPYGEALCSQKATPVLIDEGAIGLYTVDDPPLRWQMLALQSNDLMKVVQPEQGRLPTVPGKGDHWIWGGFNVLKDVLFQDIIRHAKRLLIRVEAVLFQIVTVVTAKVTDGANGFSKNLIWPGSLDHCPILILEYKIPKSLRRYEPALSKKT